MTETAGLTLAFPVQETKRVYFVLAKRHCQSLSPRLSMAERSMVTFDPALTVNNLL